MESVLEGVIIALNIVYPVLFSDLKILGTIWYFGKPLQMPFKNQPELHSPTGQEWQIFLSPPPVNF